MVAIRAVICGADGWVGVEEFGKSKLDWFKQFLELPNGILNLLNKQKSVKLGVKNKRLKAGWDDDYRLKVLFGHS